MNQRSRCEYCEAPLPTGRRGRPSNFCSDACKQAAYRRRQEQAKPQTAEDPAGTRCRYCGQRLSGPGSYCSDRCYYYDRQDRLPADKRHLTAWDKALIPSYPEGRQPVRPAWHGWVYGGEKRPGPVGPGPEERRLQQFERWRGRLGLATDEAEGGEEL